jgi:hypothetical protein
MSAHRFAAFTTNDLLAEIQRRRDARVNRRPIVHCDMCQHFKPMTGDRADTYNPCSKGHIMSFRAPEVDDGPPDSNDDWGHYRRVCVDRDLS